MGNSSYAVGASVGRHQHSPLIVFYNNTTNLIIISSMHLPIKMDTLYSYFLHQLFSTNHVSILHHLWVFLIIIQMITTSTQLHHNNYIIILFIIILSISRLFLVNHISILS